jgi:hypothetical protein
MVLSVHAPSHL